jgi:hypothetical protein
MMVGVAVVALFIGVERLNRCSIRYRRMADHYAKSETIYREFQTMCQRRALWHTERAGRWVEGWGFDDDRHRASVEAQTPDGVEAGYCRQEAAAWAALADRSSQLRRQYERAATHPWELLSPAPPLPPIEFPYRMPR